MTDEKRACLARDLKAKGLCNCAQAVIKATYDLTDADEVTLTQAVSGFAGGMGNMEATCGALIGANIILGLIVKQGTLRFTRILVSKFNEKSRATICKILKGMPSGEVLTPCDMCCYNAVTSLLEVIDENNLKK